MCGVVLVVMVRWAGVAVPVVVVLLPPVAVAVTVVVVVCEVLLLCVEARARAAALQAAAGADAAAPGAGRRADAAAGGGPVGVGVAGRDDSPPAEMIWAAGGVVGKGTKNLMRASQGNKHYPGFKAHRCGRAAGFAGPPERQTHGPMLTVRNRPVYYAAPVLEAQDTRSKAHSLGLTRRRCRHRTLAGRPSQAAAGPAVAAGAPVAAAAWLPHCRRLH